MMVAGKVKVSRQKRPAEPSWAEYSPRPETGQTGEGKPRLSAGRSDPISSRPAHRRLFPGGTRSVVRWRSLQGTRDLAWADGTGTRGRGWPAHRWREDAGSRPDPSLPSQTRPP